MSLPEILMPMSLPPFLVAGLTLETKTAYAEVPRGTGHGRKRRVATLPTTMVNVGLLLTDDQMATFDAWFENTLVVGVKAFSARIAGLGTSFAQWWQANWFAPYQAEPINRVGGLYWRVTGQLVLTGDASNAAPVMTSAAMEFVAALDGDAEVAVDGNATIELMAGLIGGSASIYGGASAEFAAALTGSCVATNPAYGIIEFAAGMLGSGTVTVPAYGAMELAAGMVTTAAIYVAPPSDTFLQFACSDEVTPLVVGRVLRLPVIQGMTVQSVLATLNVAQSAGTVLTIDIKKNGTSMLSTLITLDNSSLTSATAAVPAVLNAAQATLAVNDILTVHVTQIGDGLAAGLKLGLSGVKSP